MQPITLRIQSDLLTELESEADEHGYSSRAEYIRQLLQHRTKANAAISTDNANSGVDAEVVEDNTERIDTISAEVAQLSRRVETLEGIVEESSSESGRDSQGNNDSNVEQATTSAGQATQTAELESWLQENGPDSETAQEIIIHAAKTLIANGPLSAGELKSRLYEAYPEPYSSENTLWGSTVGRVYEDAPGFSKPEYGMYDFTG